MFNFDSLIVSELKALCAELGIAVGNSAPKSEYVAVLEKFFQDENVGEALMGIKRDNLQKVARRLSIPASGTKREMTDAILAKVINPQPEVVIDPEPEVTEPEADPEPEPVVTKTGETRKHLPEWAWALIILSTALLLWGIFHQRSVAAPAVDLSPLQTSIGQVSTKVDALGQSITGLSDRVTALEQAPAEVVEEPVKVPDTVNHFYDLATFYIDGDADVEGYKVQGQTMEYACKNDFGVFITMDPGVVNGQSTGDLGAVFFVSCKNGDIITISTPHWSDSALHQQIHLVEFTQELTDDQALNFLKVLKIDEGKEVAFFIDSEGKVTKY